MDIVLRKIKIRDLVNQYHDAGEEGVTAYNGTLDIRPKYQREFVYKPEQEKAVINTVLKGFPLNVIYWVKNDDNYFEVLDGQQRILSICRFIDNMYSINMNENRFQFHNLIQSQKDLAEKILDYDLMVFIIENGTESEKLDWFKIINIAGEKLTTQELRNAVYTGSWLTDAKRKFSKSDSIAYRLANNYIKADIIRQGYLEKSLDWISKGNIEEYMSMHQNDPNANQLWGYFSSVITWVQSTYPNYRKEMKGINWGELYDEFKDSVINIVNLENEIVRLFIDEDVTNKSGIYNYVLTHDERKLSIRKFSDKMRRESYEKQKGICPVCKKHFELNEMEADHITPWSQGGPTTSKNCQMLCKADNRTKSNI